MSEFKKTELYKEIWQASNEEDSKTFNSPEKWTSIQEGIDNIYPGFTDKLFRLSPSLTPTELKVCWLTKIGIPPTGIARVLNLSKQAISNARSKLSKKLQEASNTMKTFDQLIENL
jgi:DNA-binding NarL/FixJ family response regulator